MLAASVKMIAAVMLFCGCVQSGVVTAGESYSKVETNILLTAKHGDVSETAKNYVDPAPSDYLLDREGYRLGFNAETKQPDWVGYRLTKGKLENSKVKRTNNFHVDLEVKESATLEDYKGSGYDRGHMAPAADMKASVNEMNESFLMSNMSPQEGSCNRGVWGRLEAYVRDMAMKESSLYVYTGPVHDPERTWKGIGKSEVYVPDFCFKVLYDETPPRKMIGFIVPNRGSNLELWRFACTVDEVEEATNLNFFEGIEDEEELESGLDLDSWRLKIGGLRAEGE